MLFICNSTFLSVKIGFRETGSLQDTTLPSHFVRHLSLHRDGKSTAATSISAQSFNWKPFPQFSTFHFQFSIGLPTEGLSETHTNNPSVTLRVPPSLAQGRLLSPRLRWYAPVSAHFSAFRKTVGSVDLFVYRYIIISDIGFAAHSNKDSSLKSKSTGRASARMRRSPKRFVSQIFTEHIITWVKMLAAGGIFAKCYIAQAARQLGWGAVPKDLSRKSLRSILYHKIPILSRAFRTKVRLFCKIRIETSTFYKPVY